MKNPLFRFRHDTDSCMALMTAVDAALMRLYAATRRNSRRMVRLTAALFPLVVVLVGSCKGVSDEGSGLRLSAAEELRRALFPDRVAAAQAAYRPAEGYLSSARGYVAEKPDALKHLTGREISYLFGAPAFTRRDANATVLQYRGPDCVVDFYFYGDRKNGADDAPVSHIDIRPKGGTSEGTGCISGIMTGGA